MTMGVFLHHQAQHLHWAWRVLICVCGLLCLITGMALWTAGSSAWSDASLATVFGPPALPIGYLLLELVVVTLSAEGLSLTTGYPGWPRREFPRDQPECDRPVAFSPMRKFGGRDVRWGRSNRMCINASGDQGLEIRLPNRARVYVIGSGNPDRLAAAVKIAGGIPPREDANAPVGKAE